MKYKNRWTSTPIAVGFGEQIFTRTVHFWINEILMVVFFFVVGLEVRRELFEGELSTPRRAALPVAAALGGMLVPAAIYISLNAGSPAVRSWGEVVHRLLTLEDVIFGVESGRFRQLKNRWTSTPAFNVKSATRRVATKAARPWPRFLSSTVC